jgi:hypothetical protein
MRYAECCYAECRYAECRYAEYRGAIITGQKHLIYVLMKYIVPTIKTGYLIVTTCVGWRIYIKTRGEKVPHFPHYLPSPESP